MFVVLVNDTANPGPPRNWGVLLTQPLRARKPLEMTHGKLIDDASIAEAIDMNSVLSPQPESYWTRPVTWRERYELAVPAPLNKSSAKLVKMTEFADAHFMKINHKKTKVVMFNPRRRGIDFKPDVRLRNNPLDVIDHTRLVGFVLSDNLNWEQNTESIVNRAYAKVWILRRVKALGGSKKILKLIYF